jgi:hypothetical protein
MAVEAVGEGEGGRHGVQVSDGSSSTVIPPGIAKIGMLGL